MIKPAGARKIIYRKQFANQKKERRTIVRRSRFLPLSRGQFTSLVELFFYFNFFLIFCSRLLAAEALMPNAFPISELDAPPSSFQIYALKALSLIKTMKSAALSKKSRRQAKAARRRYLQRSKKFSSTAFCRSETRIFICLPSLPAENIISSSSSALSSAQVKNCFFIPIGEQPP